MAASKSTPVEDPLVAKAFDKDAKDDEIKAAIAALSPEEAQFFLHKLEAAFKKRKMQLTGYLVAIAVWLLGMVGALAYFGTHDGFVGWVFLMPFALVGVILYVFGRISNRIGAAAQVPKASIASASKTQ